MRGIGRLVLTFLGVFFIATMMFTALPIGSRFTTGDIGEYDSWADLNDDGCVNAKDAVILGKAFESNGTVLEKASIQFDSGWIDISDRVGQNITINHGLNLALNDESWGFDIIGKTTLASEEILRDIGSSEHIVGWNKTYGSTSGLELAREIIQTTDGGYALVGYTYSFGAGNGDFWLVKINADGSEQWNKTYGGAYAENAFEIIQTDDGGYALIGYTYSLGAGNGDFWLVKTDANGNEQWNKTFGGALRDLGFSIVQANDGGYVLSGHTESFGAGNDDYWLMKTDASGNLQWNRTYGGAADDHVYSLAETTDEGFVMIGYTQSFGDSNGDAWLVKTDEDGIMQWNQTYGGTEIDLAYSIVQLGDGGYIFVGRTTSPTMGDYDAWFVKMDAFGEIVQNKNYGGTHNDFAQYVVETNDGGYVLVGWTASFGAGGYDAWIIRTNENGDSLWNRTYGGSNHDDAFCVLQTLNNEYVVVGSTDSFGLGNVDMWVIRTDNSGNCYYTWGLAWIGTSPHSIFLYRPILDQHWNFVRVRIWKNKP